MIQHLKKISLLCLIYLSCVWMIGCGKFGEGEAAGQEKEEADVVSSGKNVLTYGGISAFIDPSVRSAIRKFNAENSDYYIEIKEYSGDTTEAVQAGISQLNADIISGTGPDILALPVRFSMNVYDEKGVLEDLYPYIDNDKILDRNDFVPNIIKAYETDGKLYGIPVVFEIKTMIGKPSVIGNRSSWNIDDMISFADNCDGGTPIFEDASKSGVMEICMYANWGEFIDWNDDDIGFNRELYIKNLEFSNRFIDDEKYMQDFNYKKRINDGQLLLMSSNANIWGVACDSIYSGLFDEPVSYIGYPSETGNGSLGFSYTITSINSKSTCKEGAWEFVRSLLLKENHVSDNFIRGFSIRKDGLKKQLENAKKQGLGIYMIGEDYKVEIKPSKEEEVQRIRKLIDSVDRIYTYDYEISRIMKEEAGAYFAGYKTAGEVADIVENRIQIYVSETK